MSRTYCPLSMYGGKPMECVERRGVRDMCRACPAESIDKAAGSLAALAYVLNLEASEFGTAGIAGAIADIAAALQKD